MKTPSTADSGEPSGAAADPGRARRSTTRATVKGEPAPRLPHERDESSDSGTAPPDPLMQQAADDLQSGKRPTDRSAETDALYRRTLRGENGNADGGDGSGQAPPGGPAGKARR